jgi:hypothetical protein
MLNRRVCEAWHILEAYMWCRQWVNSVFHFEGSYCCILQIVQVCRYKLALWSFIVLGTAHPVTQHCTSEDVVLFWFWSSTTVRTLSSGAALPSEPPVLEQHYCQNLQFWSSTTVRTSSLTQCYNSSSILGLPFWKLPVALWLIWLCSYWLTGLREW